MGAAVLLDQGVPATVAKDVLGALPGMHPVHVEPVDWLAYWWLVSGIQWPDLRRSDLQGGR